MTSTVETAAMKKKIDSHHSELMTHYRINRVENLATLPETVKRYYYCRPMPNFTVCEPVAFVVKKQNVIGFGHGGKIAQNDSTHANLR